jgi:CPA1 family monovalent cation:H+ antiporter
VFQGLTLKPLLLALDLRDGDPVGQEVDRARERALSAALGTFESDTSPVAEAVRHEFTAHLGSAADERAEGQTIRAAHTDLHRRALEAARSTVLDMRAKDDIGDDAFHVLEEEFDWIEMGSGFSSST